ncbi:MAG: Glutamate-1-semialdehyde 2,1-aminomutase [Alphaproteobacteria bacterium MarineAlpha11_Bin1]|nr:MAG: Glutamate-1-semialdehyde 2,1-aminomutase [Alphaproteobacteria bacterium MarineAlpha11_Bin1]|tara:strand:- start:28343 stop:29671 length:1329 start_codon:yes stop_codon:yes gene_type:complete
MTPADTAMAGPKDLVGARAHDDYYEVATDSLPGAGLGSYSLPDDVRFVIHKGEGSRLQDVRGRWYIDYVGGAGALILGHAFPTVVDTVKDQAERGIHFFGTLNEQCIQLAEELKNIVPCADRIAFTTTGSEATAYAMRTARAATGRSKILKFEGAYHGNHDYSAFSVTPTALSNYPQGRPDTGGLPANMGENVLVAPYNDLDTVRKIVEENRDDLAGIIVEPVQRIIFPDDRFLPGLRKICDDNDVLLIFDEVVTGFRLALGGAQEYFGVLPDIASYGKIVGGGGPLGFVGGKAEYVDLMNPRNKGQASYSYVNGTLHGNPVAAAAGIATLAELKRPSFYKDLHALSDDVGKACQEVLNKNNLRAIVAGKASFWQILFMDSEPRTHADVMNSDAASARALDLAQMHEGLYVLPNVRRFVSAVHTGQDIEDTVRALDAACKRL